MPLWTSIATGTSISDLVSNIEINQEAIASHQRGTVEPVNMAPKGALWVNTNHPFYGEVIEYCRADGNFYPLIDPDHVQLNNGGTVGMAGNLSFNNFKILTLGQATANGHAVRYQQAVLKNESTGVLVDDLDMGSAQRIKNLPAPAASTDPARLADLQPDTTGLFDFVGILQLAQAADDANTYQAFVDGLGNQFTPRKLTIRLKGNVNDQADGDLNGTIDWEKTVYRWNAPITPAGEFLVQSGVALSGGVKTVDIYVEFKTTSPRGAWVRVRRSDNNEYQDVQYRQCIAEFGQGQ